MKRSVRLTAVVLAVLAFLLPAPSGAAAQRPLEASAWTADLDVLLTAWSEMHPQPWRALARSEFEARLAQIAAESESRSHSRVVVEIMRLLADATRPGRDGHTGLWPIQRAACFTLFPLHLYRFADGVHVLRATDGHDDLRGARLVTINGRPIAEVLAAVEPLVSRESDMWVTSWSPLFASIPQVLEALFGTVPERVAFEFRMPDGDVVRRDLEAISARAYDEAFPLALQVAMLPPDPDGPLYLRHLRRFFGSAMLDAETLYFQYNLVLPEDSEGRSFTAFVDTLREQIESRWVRRLVIDIRNNGGGDNTTYDPFFEMLDALRADGALPELYAIIGRVTFSAAINFAVDLDNRHDVTFVGEPTGGSPNQFGDPEYVMLPNSGLAVRISTRFWNLAGDADRRLTLEPDIAVNLASADYLAGRDPLLEAAVRRR